MSNITQSTTLGSDDPRGLEDAYWTAKQQGRTDSFVADMLDRYRNTPDNPLYAAWYYRLQGLGREGETGEAAIAWRMAAVLALLTGIIFAVLLGSRFTFDDGAPYLMLLWSPIVAVSVYAFLVRENDAARRRALPVLGSVLAAGVYVFTLSAWLSGETYRILMMLHLPLLAWLCVGLGLLGWRSSARERFAGLIKSLEIGITGGVFGIAVGIFAMITMGLFQALSVHLPDWTIRLLFGGAAGLVPVMAVAVAYQPQRSILAQRFEQGVGRLAPILMRLLLPLTLLVLIVYLCFIPFNFMGPFRNRELLVVYNVMLFAVMGLLIGATPLRETDLAQRTQDWLRRAILAVAALSVIISIYALAAVVTRTWLGGFTANRVTVIGWNTINIGLLITLLYRQWRDGREVWIASFQKVVSAGLIVYAGWTLVLVLTLPFLFRGA
ncbi:MAG: hypothetical protein KF893_10055 [Caldilineaceae bacterium]|nr:hypothetical protein [Caldilineaceae bacterium]